MNKLPMTILALLAAGCEQRPAPRPSQPTAIVGKQVDNDTAKHLEQLWQGERLMQRLHYKEDHTIQLRRAEADLLQASDELRSATLQLRRANDELESRSLPRWEDISR